jgi:hypothetical protein
MILSKPTHPPKLRTLAQQHDDFTAEGSPPPDKVATTIPATTATPKVSALPMPQRATPARKGPLVGRSRWQR